MTITISWWIVPILIVCAEPNAQALREAGDLMQDEVKKSAVAEADLPASKT